MRRNDIYKSLPVSQLLEEWSGVKKSVRLSTTVQNESSSDALSKLREIIGRANQQPIASGDHPDFCHIKAGSDEEAPTTSVFIDLKNSTLLNLKMDKRKAAKLKQSLLESATIVFQAFDGIVHRFHGDGMLVFFGRKSQHPTVGVLDAINATSTLMVVVQSYLNPQFELNGWEPIKLRAGIDHEPAAIWGFYGSGSSYEITAHGLHVDLAAKLQHKAGENRIMLGDNVRAALDLPEQFLDVKTVSVDGKAVSKPFILDRTELRYRMWLFDWASYARQFEWIEEVNGALELKGPRNLMTEPLRCYVLNENGLRMREYLSSLEVLPKGHTIEFALQTIMLAPLRSIEWSVRNYGAEAELADCVQYELPDERNEKVVTRETGYLGRHIMKCKIVFQSGQVMTKEIAVVVGPHRLLELSSPQAESRPLGSLTNTTQREAYDR